MKALTGLLVALGLLGITLVVVFYVPVWADEIFHDGKVVLHIPEDWSGNVMDSSGTTLYFKGKPIEFKATRGIGGYNLISPIEVPPEPDGRIESDRSKTVYTTHIGTDSWECLTQEQRNRAIREWAASGEICRVLGHRWENGPIPYHVEFRQIGNDWIVDKSYPELGRNQRRCPICGKVETRTEKWE